MLSMPSRTALLRQGTGDRGCHRWCAEEGDDTRGAEPLARRLGRAGPLRVTARLGLDVGGLTAVGPGRVAPDRWVSMSPMTHTTAMRTTRG
jgi:hypothetical protein